MPEEKSPNKPTDTDAAAALEEQKKIERLQQMRIAEDLVEQERIERLRRISELKINEAPAIKALHAQVDNIANKIQEVERVIDTLKTSNSSLDVGDFINKIEKTCGVVAIVPQRMSAVRKNIDFTDADHLQNLRTALYNKKAFVLQDVTDRENYLLAPSALTEKPKGFIERIGSRVSSKNTSTESTAKQPVPSESLPSNNTTRQTAATPPSKIQTLQDKIKTLTEEIHDINDTQKELRQGRVTSALQRESSKLQDRKTVLIAQKATVLLEIDKLQAELDSPASLDVVATAPTHNSKASQIPPASLKTQASSKQEAPPPIDTKRPVPAYKTFLADLARDEKGRKNPDSKNTNDTTPRRPGS